MLHRTGSRKLHTAKQLTPHHGKDKENSAIGDTTVDSNGVANVRYDSNEYSS